MTYALRQLGDFFRIKHGYAFKGEYFADEGPHVLLTPGNFEAGGGLKHKGEKEKYYRGEFPEDFLLKRGDLLIAMTDLTQNAPILGAPAVIPRDNLYLHNQRLGKIINLKTEELDRDYLYYLMSLPSVRDQIKASATGATVKHTAPDRIYAVSAPIPPLIAQRRIASVLSAYDYLIENNNRRIAIVEEVVRRTYEEWFVHFRFPGHEQVRMVESEVGLLPEGWESKHLAEVAAINQLSIRPATAPEEILYVDIASVTPGAISQKGRYAFSEAPGRARRVVRHGDILWSCVRPNRRSYALALRPEPNLIASTGFAVITARSIPYSYLYLATTTDDFVAYLTNHATGAAYPAVTASTFEGSPIITPTTGVLDQFDAVTAPMLDLCNTLMRKNANLQAARDLLLPRLISGELPVSAIAEPEEVVPA